MCIDYRKIKKTTHKDHYPLPFIDQMLERSSKRPGFSETSIQKYDQEKTTFTCPFGTFAHKRMPFDFTQCSLYFFRDV